MGSGFLNQRRSASRTRLLGRRSCAIWLWRRRASSGISYRRVSEIHDLQSPSSSSYPPKSPLRYSFILERRLSRSSIRRLDSSCPALLRLTSVSHERAVSLARRSSCAAWASWRSRRASSFSMESSSLWMQSRFRAARLSNLRKTKVSLSGSRAIHPATAAYPSSGGGSLLVALVCLRAACRSFLHRLLCSGMMRGRTCSISYYSSQLSWVWE